MSVTPGKTKFKVWRENVDETLETKAKHSESVTTTLLASGWAGIDAPYTYELEVEGLGAEQNGKIGVAQSATFEERQMAREAQLCLVGQENGKLYVAADGEMPDIDIPLCTCPLKTIYIYFVAMLRNTLIR